MTIRILEVETSSSSVDRGQPVSGLLQTMQELRREMVEMLRVQGNNLCPRLSRLRGCGLQNPNWTYILMSPISSFPGCPLSSHRHHHHHVTATAAGGATSSSSSTGGPNSNGSKAIKAATTTTPQTRTPISIRL